MFVGENCDGSVVGLCFVMQYLKPFLVLLSSYKEKTGCLTLIVFMLLSGCEFNAYLPRSASDLSVVCDCGISWS